jgi:hypothetical protein
MLVLLPLLLLLLLQISHPEPTHLCSKHAPGCCRCCSVYDHVTPDTDLKAAESMHVSHHPCQSPTSMLRANTPLPLCLSTLSPL